MSQKHELPQKIPSYLRRLEIMYRDSQENSIYYQIICNASVHVRESVSHKNPWDDLRTGHSIALFLEEEILRKIGSFDNQNAICEKLTNDLRECSQSFSGEFVRSVDIALYDENDLECRRSIKPIVQPAIDPDTLSMWKTGHIRLFISHRDQYKRQVSELATALEGYGVSAFVAHADIEPMEKWQHVIRKSLQSMEVMLAFITEDFFNSTWTNQEIGVALGRNIPIIPLKVHKNANPVGFISDIQALHGDIESHKACVDGVYRVLAEKLGQEERLRKATVQAFITSESFDDTILRFNRLNTLSKLTESDVQQIIDGFSSNNQLHNSFYLCNRYGRLVSFLENRTGKKFAIEGRTIREVGSNFTGDEDIPF